jgi:ubiquinone/menaquinone biosynthesis C-methylase UbiE
LDRTYPGNQSESGLRTAVSESGARALAAGTANLSFRQGDGRDLPLPDARFGLAVPHTVPSHVPDPQVELAEAFRVLRPGGTLAAFDGDYNALSVATSDTAPAPTPFGHIAHASLTARKPG